MWFKVKRKRFVWNRRGNFGRRWYMDRADKWLGQVQRDMGQMQAGRTSVAVTFGRCGHFGPKGLF